MLVLSIWTSALWPAVERPFIKSSSLARGRRHHPRRRLASSVRFPCGTDPGTKLYYAIKTITLTGAKLQYCVGKIPGVSRR